MLEELIEKIKLLESFFPFLAVLLVAFVAYVLFGFSIRALRKALLQKAKTKKQIANIEASSRIF